MIIPVYYVVMAFWTFVISYYTFLSRLRFIIIVLAIIKAILTANKFAEFNSKFFVMCFFIIIDLVVISIMITDTIIYDIPIIFFAIQTIFAPLSFIIHDCYEIL